LIPAYEDTARPSIPKTRRARQKFRLLLVPALLLAALATVSCSQVGPSSAANAAGTWTWNYDGGGQAVTHTYVLKQSGDTLTGTFKDSVDETTAEIKNGSLKGDQVSFTVDRPLGGQGSINFTFTGKLEGNTITGKAEWTMMDQPTTADWVAKRNP
jgi:hypothetical protein